MLDEPGDASPALRGHAERARTHRSTRGAAEPVGVRRDGPRPDRPTQDGTEFDRTPLAREFFARPVLDVAPDLLGRTLLRNTPEGPVELRLTEVEAYDGPSDPGSHAYRGKTARNASMFGPPGHAYVYFIYGMWYSLNLVCGSEGVASGVLLRAGEITAGAEWARARRRAARKDSELAQGPARLAAALDIVRSELDGTDVCAGPDAPLAILTGRPAAPERVRNGPRTGVGGDGAAHPWRYWIEGDPTVSRYRAHVHRHRKKAT